MSTEIPDVADNIQHRPSMATVIIKNIYSIIYSVVQNLADIW